MRQKSILGASFHSCCDPIRVCGDSSFFPPQASLPVCELLWPVPGFPPETFPGLLERLSPGAWLPDTDLFAPLFHLAEECQKGT